MPSIRRAVGRLAPPVVALAALPAPAAAQVQGIAGPSSIVHGQFAWVVASLPDVNGDGRPDVAVSSSAGLHDPRWPNYPTTSKGRVFLYSGGSGAFLRSIYPGSLAPGFGYALAGVPDLSGDGRGDLVIASGGAFYAGEHGDVAVYSGATGQWLRTLAQPPAAGAWIFGYAVAGIDDLNGDGRGDLLVGAVPIPDTGAGTPNGRVHVYSGATGGLIRSINVGPSVEPGSELRLSLAAVPDLNADGKPDVVVGRPGRVVVYSGGTGAALRTVNAPVGARGFGFSVAAVPDADGDGAADLVVGAPRSDVHWPVHAEYAGRAYLFSGRTGALLFSRRGPAVEDDNFGRSVAGIPDMNGDGRGDFAIAAPNGPYADPPRPGVVAVYSGATGAPLKLIQSHNAENGGLFGFSISGLSDTNANGRGDLIIGAPCEDPGGHPDHNRGRAYFVRH